MAPSLRSQRSQLFANPSSRGDSLTPPHGYSSLFTSGLMRSDSPLTPPPGIRTPSYATPPRSHSRAGFNPNEDIVMSCADPSIPSPVAFATATSSPYVSRLHPPRSPSKTQRPSPSRRLPSSPSKLRGPPTLAADRALTDVMHKLRLYAGGLSPNKAAGAGSGGIGQRGNSPLIQSRWSYSSEESGAGVDENDGGDGFWKPRKSGESTRSRVSKAGTVKSKRSVWSLRSRRSEEMEVERPPMPEWTKEVESKGRKFGGGKKTKVEVDIESKGQGQAPMTPGRGRRVVEGLARRLGLTPKKKNAPPTPSRPVAMPDYSRDMLPPPVPVRACTPTLRPQSPHTQSRAQTPAPTHLPNRSAQPYPSTAPAPPTGTTHNLPQPPTRNTDPNLPLPRKTSLSTLRSLAKKTSTGTLRSVRSIYGQPTPIPDSPAPLLPPTTPRRPVTKKTSMGPISISQPKAARPSFSPSLFDSLPRRAPKTPDRAEEGGGEGSPWGGEDVRMKDEEGMMMMDVDEIITFSRSKRVEGLGVDVGSPDSPHTPIEADDGDGEGDRTMSPIYRTPDISTPRAMIPTSLNESPSNLYSHANSPIFPHSTSPNHTSTASVPSPDPTFDHDEFRTSTPISQRNMVNTSLGSLAIPAFASEAFNTPPRTHGRDIPTPPLTVKQLDLVGGLGQGQGREGKDQRVQRSKSRLMSLLPSYNRYLNSTTGEVYGGTVNHRGGVGVVGEEGAGKKPMEEGLMPKFRKSFSRSKNNASTPLLRNGLPVPAPTSSSSSSQSRITHLPLHLHLGNTTTAAIPAGPNRPPLGPIRPPNPNTHIYPTSASPLGPVGYTYRSGAVSRADGEDLHAPTKLVDLRSKHEEYTRPATSQGHHHRSKPMIYPQPHPYAYSQVADTAIGLDFRAGVESGVACGVIGGDGAVDVGVGKTKKLYPRRRVPDFSRPMSAQDLDTSFGSTISANSGGDHVKALTPSAIHAGMGMDIDPSRQGVIQSHTPIIPHSPQQTTNSDAHTNTPTLTPTHPLTLTSSRSRSPKHERMSSKDSLMTADTGCTVQTNETSETYATGVSGTSGWELERYLKELESEDEADVGGGVGGGEGGGGGVGEGRMERMERMDVDMEAEIRGSRIKGPDRVGTGSGSGTFGAGGVIQQAKYGIRI